MPEYQYRCPGCRHIFTTLSRTDIPPCPVCRTPAQRKFSFGIVRGVSEHFNYSVGQYVSNERELREELKRAGEDQYLRTGIENDLEYLSRADIAEASSHGVTEEGLDSTASAWSEIRSQ